MRRYKKNHAQDAELDVTSFMNLMIVLVPVLLLNMVFSQLATLDLHLPSTTEALSVTPEEVSLEVIIRDHELEISRSYQGHSQRILTLPKQGQDYDFDGLNRALQDIKKDPVFAEKTAISLLSEPQVSYQSLVSAMDAVRSFPAVVAANLVNATLFPDVSLGDAPEVSQ